MEGNKAGPHCIAFGVRGREELACLNNNKDGEKKKNAPLRGHLRGAHFVFVLTVGWKNGGQSRRGKHRAGGRFVPNVVMKDSLMKERKRIC